VQRQKQLVVVCKSLQLRELGKGAQPFIPEASSHTSWNSRLGLAPHYREAVNEKSSDIPDVIERVCCRERRV
jgi:hypothetical protein